MVSILFVPRHLMFLALSDELSGWPEPTQIEHIEPILFVLDAQTTSNENGCQASHEEVSKDAVVPHLLYVRF
jgi:hypothetical protein